MHKQEKPLSGRVALVTGASRGIGRALALALAEQGASLVLAARDQNDLAEVEGLALRQGGNQVLTQPTDVGQGAEVERLAAAIKDAFGHLDILINNAGVGRMAQVAESDPAEVELMVRVNLLGPYLVTRHCLPLMLGRGHGDIVNISSVAGVLPSPGYAMYAASKAGVSSLTSSLRQELRRESIRVMEVLPGMTGSHFFQGFNAEGKPPFDLGDKELLRPREIARAIVDALLLPPNAAVNQLTIRPTWQER